MEIIPVPPYGPSMLKTKKISSAKAKGSESPKAHDKYFSRAVSKALDLLDLLQAESGSLPMNEIAQRLQLSKTSAFRLLRTLEMTGHVVQDGRGLYKAAPGIHGGTSAQWVSRLIRLGMPRLSALSLELTETVSLAALFENRIEVVSVVESPHDVRMSNVVGHILPPNASSLGKVITAFQQPAQREKLLRSFKIYRFTENTITDPRELYREYERVRQREFATDREECALGGVCFSVPIFGPERSVPAAISLSMPITRLAGPELESSIIATLRAAADQLAADLASA